MVLSPPPTSIPGMPAELAAYVETERRRADVAGAAIVAFDRNGPRFQGYSGHANIARGEPVTADSLFRAASISKLFTATLLMQEIDAGRIALDDPVNEHLDARTRVLDAKGLPARGVTIRHLLTHTSGLPVSWKGIQYPSRVLSHISSGLRLPHSLEDVVAGMRTIRSPGVGIAYSNGAFALLGYVVQRLNGRPFAELVKERVLEPLGMRDSGFVVEPRMPRLATPYGGVIMGSGRKAAPFIKIVSGPEGGLCASALELSRFGRMVLCGGELDGRRVFPRHLLAEALELTTRAHPELDSGLGLAFFVSNVRGRRAASHSGGLAGVATRLLVLPDDGIGVAVLTNGGDASYVNRVSDRVVESMLGLDPELVPGSPAGVPDALATHWRAFTARVAGRYRLIDQAPPGIVDFLMGRIVRTRLVHVSDGVLAVEGLGGEPAFLYPDGDVGQYRLAHPIANGARAIIDEHRDGAHLWVDMLHGRRLR